MLASPAVKPEYYMEADFPACIPLLTAKSDEKAVM